MTETQQTEAKLSPRASSRQLSMHTQPNANEISQSVVIKLMASSCKKAKVGLGAAFWTKWDGCWRKKRASRDCPSSISQHGCSSNKHHGPDGGGAGVRKKSAKRVLKRPLKRRAVRLFAASRTGARQRYQMGSGGCSAVISALYSAVAPCGTRYGDGPLCCCFLYFGGANDLSSGGESLQLGQHPVFRRQMLHSSGYTNFWLFCRSANQILYYRG